MSESGDDGFLDLAGPRALVAFPVHEDPAEVRDALPSKRQLHSQKMHRAKAANKCNRMEACLQENVVACANELNSTSVRAGFQAKATRVGSGNWALVIKDADGGKGSFVSPSAMLDIAYAPTMCTAVLAAQFKCDRGTIRRAKEAVAQAWLVKQAEKRASVQDHWRAGSEVCMRYRIRTLRWDETKEKVFLKFNPQLFRWQQEAAWHVLVSRRLYAFGTLVDIEGYTRETCSEFQLVCPIVPLVSTAAGAIWEGLFSCPVAKGNSDFDELVDEVPDEDVLIIEVDAAASNDTVIAKLMMEAAVDGELPRGKTIITMKCRLHQNSIIEGAVVGVVAPKVLHDMYSGCLFLGYGTNFAQLITSLDSVFTRDTLSVRRGAPPPPDPHDVNQELMAYSVANYGRFKSHGKGYDDVDPDDPGIGGDVDDDVAHERRPDVAEWINSWNSYRAVCNDRYERGRWGHTCIDENCCAGYRYDVTKGRLKRTCARLQFKTRPKPPASGKWTKLGPAADFFVVAYVSGLLPVCAEAAYGKRKVVDAELDDDFMLAQDGGTKQKQLHKSWAHDGNRTP